MKLHEMGIFCCPIHRVLIEKKNRKIDVKIKKSKVLFALKSVHRLMHKFTQNHEGRYCLQKLYYNNYASSGTVNFFLF